MEQNSQLSRGYFSSLPVEVRYAILCEIPDIQTLHVAVRADATLNSTFLTFRSRIEKRVLLNCLPSKLRPEVVAVMASSHLTPQTWQRKTVDDILDKYFQPRSPEPLGWDPAEQEFISNMHRHVQFFVDDFASSALSVHPVTGEPHTPAPLSPNEQYRLAGAFYRFELYCNLFRSTIGHDEDYEDPMDVDYMTQWEIFLSKFSLWEIIQLGCVYDYLSEKIDPAYADKARHDITWGKLGVADPGDSDDETALYATAPFKASILSSGLATLHTLVLASTFEERSPLMVTDHQGNMDFLQDALMACDLGDLGYHGKVSECSEEQLQTLKDRSFTDDPDPGPYNAWRWAHANAFGTWAVYADYGPYDYMPLRKRGYVMWDDSRLVREWDLFSKPYEKPKAPSDPGREVESSSEPEEAEAMDDAEVDESFEEDVSIGEAVEDGSVEGRGSNEEATRNEKVDSDDESGPYATYSGERRAKIWKMGGRGWWSKDDESRVVWGHSKSDP
ncbi:hypothetical protein FQN52_006368 [Onygenales sp. PD_12]|nr:hypothetical protein FQN52_006368 [Onygenales sp. PD_12]